MSKSDIVYEPTAEIAILSCLCNAGKEAQREMLDSINESHFYLEENRIVYRAALRQIASGHTADWINVMDALKQSNEFDLIGGQPAMSKIATFCNAQSRWRQYYPKLEEARYRRSLEALAMDMVFKARDRDVRLEELKDWSETSVMKADFLVDDDNKLSIKDATIQAVDNIEAILKGKPNRGLSTGIQSIDSILSFGLRGGDMVVVAARPSRGKSAVCMQIAEHVALDCNKRVLVFSLEMTAASLMERMICSRARINVAQMMLGQITEAQQTALGTVSMELVNSKNLLCNDSASKSIGYIKSVARRAHQKQPLDLIVIDYMQLVKGTTKRSEGSRFCEVQEVSAGVKELAKTLNIPVIVAAQLNRNSEGTGGKKSRRPALSDLRESGDIEQDADIVALLHPKEDEEAETLPSILDVDIIIAKHRNGATGIAKTVFHRSITRFEDKQYAQPTNYNED